MTDEQRTVDLAAREWRRLGVLPQTRSDLAAELHADLLAAASDGRPPMEVTGEDVAVFARDWAYARGDVPIRAYYLRSFIGAWTGLLIGGLIAIGLIAFLSAAGDSFGLNTGFAFAKGGTSALVAYLCTGAGCYLGAVIGVYLSTRQREDPYAEPTAIHLIWTLGVGMLVALGSGVGTASALDYPNQRAFVAGEVFLVGGVLSAAVVLARRLAVRTPALLAGPGHVPITTHAASH